MNHSESADALTNSTDSVPDNETYARTPLSARTEYNADASEPEPLDNRQPVGNEVMPRRPVEVERSERPVLRTSE